jgi:hypothetical protein
MLNVINPNRFPLMETRMNEIIINKGGCCTIVGSLAHKFYYKLKDVIGRLHELDSTNVAWVFEQDGTLRAAQSTVDNARAYMRDDRILVSKSSLTAWGS